MNSENRIILIGLILTAAVLRFYNLFEIPYTYDEFSALFRLDFDSFGELIEKGVKIDGHPPGVHVFLYYYGLLFGYSAWVTKIPFILAGIASVYLIYRMALIWFNPTVGLLTASYLASIQYTVMYSQIARMYISGMFFSILLVLFWTKIVREPEKNFKTNAAFFIVSAILCAYNHHFSLLFAFIVGVSGLFFIPRRYLRRYLFIGLLIILAYLPNLPIFLYQLSLGGVEQWLGKPKNSFIIDYFRYFLQYNPSAYLLFGILVVVGFITKKMTRTHLTKLILFSLFFFLPFIIGFLYSRYLSAVLQYSVLIFGFPFLLFALLGSLPELKPKFNLLLVFFVVALNIYGLVEIREHYSIFYNSPYASILEDLESTRKEYPHSAALIHSHDRISEYLSNQMNFKEDYENYLKFGSSSELINYLENLDSEHLYLGLLSENDSKTIPLVERYFPHLVWQNNYFNGTTYLFAKEGGKPSGELISAMNFEGEKPQGWSEMNTENISDSMAYTGKHAYHNKNAEWTISFEAPLDGISTHMNNFIDVQVKIYPQKNWSDILLVSQISSGDKVVDWRATALDSLVSHKNGAEWIDFIHSLPLAPVDLDYPKLKFTTFIWNIGKNEFYMDDFEIRRRTGNPLIYSRFEDIVPPTEH